MSVAFFVRLRSNILKSLPQIVFFTVIFFIFLTNTVHESYPDEFDDILGGWYMLHGKFLYSGFFTHHNPVGYILSAIIEVFSGQSFVRFRLVYALVLFGYVTWTYLFFRRKFPQRDTSFYLFVIGLFAVGATYFWGHMLLADNIAALLLLPVFGLLFLRTFYKEKLLFSDIVWVSIFSSLAFLTAATYVYLIAIVYAYTLFFYVYENKIPLVSWKMIKALLVLGIPYIIFVIYLLLTGALLDYYYQNLVFNPRFYVYNYPRPEGAPFNPIRYAIIVMNDFNNNFSSLFLGVKDFNFNFPFNMTLAVVNVGIIIYLLVQRRFSLALFLYLIIVYANVRTNVLTSRETDYQSSVYILITFFNMAFILRQLYADLEKPSLVLPKKVIFSFLILIIGIYTAFNASYLYNKYSEKTFKKYMGVQALIYDRPQVAPLLNSITNENDLVWIGPFAFEELFYSDRKTPSKYIILLPEFARFPHIKDEFMKDFAQNKPKVIYFDKHYSIRGYEPQSYAGFFLEYLEKYYINLLTYKENNARYVAVNGPTEKLDIEAKLFINKENKEEVIKKLLDQNLIRKESVK